MSEIIRIVFDNIYLPEVKMKEMKHIPRKGEHINIYPSHFPGKPQKKLEDIDDYWFKVKDINHIYFTDRIEIIITVKIIGVSWRSMNVDDEGKFIKK